jgi:hypothetical protein
MREMNRKTTTTALLVLLAIGLIYPLTRPRAFSYSNDSSHYVGSARSLASGQGYVFDGTPETQYPPGLPLLIMPFVHAQTPFAGVDVSALYCFMAFFGIAGLLVSYLYLRSKEEPYSLLLCLMIAANSTFYVASSTVMSDVAYLVFSLGFLLWLDRCMRVQEKSVAWWMLGLLLLVMALMLRTISVALVAGMMLTIVVQRRRRRLARYQTVLLAVLIAVGVVWTAGWMHWTSTHLVKLYGGELPRSYLGQLLMADPHHPDLGSSSAALLLWRLPLMALERAAQVAQLLTNGSWYPRALSSPVLFAVVVPCTLGWVQDLKSQTPLSACYVLCYFGVLLLWPFAEDPRFELPVIPLLLLYGVRGVRIVLGWAATKSRIVFAAVAFPLGGLFGGVLLLNMHAAVHGTSSFAWLTGDWSIQYKAAMLLWAAALLASFSVISLKPFGTRTLAGVRWTLVIAYLAVYGFLGVRQIGDAAYSHVHPNTEATLQADARRAWFHANVGPGDAIMAEEAAGLALMTGHHTIEFPATSRASTFAAVLCRWEPRYVVIGDSTGYPYFLPQQPERMAIIQRVFPGGFRLVHEYVGGKIYEFDPAMTSRCGSGDLGSAPIL